MPFRACFVFFMAFLLSGFVVSGQHSSSIVFSDSLQALLLNYRNKILVTPDSCEAEFELVYQEAMRTGEYLAIAKAKNLRGIGYAYQNRIPESITYFLECNEIASKLEPSDILVDCRNNIANMYITQGDTAKSLEYFNLGMEAAVAYGNLDRELITRIQLASLEIDCGELDQAFTNLKQIEAHYQEIQETDVKAYYHIAMCRYYYEYERYDSAMFHAQIGLKQYRELKDVIGISTCTYYVGMIRLKTGDAEGAIQACSESYTVSDTSELDIWKSQSCECLWQAYEKKGNYERAFYYHLKLSQLNEEIKNDERIRDITKMEMEVQFTKTRYEDSLKTAETAMIQKNQQEMAIQEERSKNIILYIGLGFMGIIALILYRNFRSKQRDNLIILEQKNTVEQKQHEIMDSINYAKRLQDAILPASSQIEKTLPDHFIFFAPKDIVSGDFYWFEKNASNNGSNFCLLAASDCTGHGVPGAMVSVVCSNALRRSVKEFNLTNPGEILDMVSSIVVETFENDQNEVKDGMDIALVKLNDPDVFGNRHLEFAGANNPLWIVRQRSGLLAESHPQLPIVYNETGDLALLEVKGDRQPVGRFVDKKPFETSSLQLFKGDLVYLFTDGFPDQFGGPKGKKFKYQAFKKLILSMAHLPLKDQHKTLANTLAIWQREFEQTDDICVIGIRI